MNTGNYFQVPKKRLCKSFRLSMICQCNVTLLGFNDGPQQKTIVKDQQGMSLGDEFSTHKQPGVKGGCNASFGVLSAFVLEHSAGNKCCRKLVFV